MCCTCCARWQISFPSSVTCVTTTTASGEEEGRGTPMMGGGGYCWDMRVGSWVHGAPAEFLARRALLQGVVGTAHHSLDVDCPQLCCSHRMYAAHECKEAGAKDCRVITVRAYERSENDAALSRLFPLAGMRRHGNQPRFVDCLPTNDCTTQERFV